MSDDNKKETPPEPTVITLVLPVDKTTPATVTVRNGELGHFSSFAYDGFKEICTALNAGMRAFVDVQANPPQNIPSLKPAKAKTSKKTSKKKAKKAAGKPPYKLQDSKGNVRVLDKMFDPFELQDKYHKDNPKFKFDDLDKALEVAQTLLDAGLEKQITITYSNGKAVQVLPEPEATQGETDTPEPPSDPPDESETPDDTAEDGADNPTTSVEVDTQEAPAVVEAIDGAETTVAPDSDGADTDDETVAGSVEENSEPEFDTDAKHAMFAVLQDESLTHTIYQAIQSNKKHGWKKNLIKQREVKGIIALYVDGKEAQVEALYQIALDSFEFADPQQATTAAASKPAPVITVVTSPELAKAKDVPEYNEFTLATSDDEDDVDDLEAIPVDEQVRHF